jgi:hypothetical protein
MLSIEHNERLTSRVRVFSVAAALAAVASIDALKRARLHN